jgi:hypothetical protein
MKQIKLLIFTVLSILFLQTVDAQKVLLLQKSGKTTRFFYRVGDKIIVRIGDPEYTLSGEITYLDDSICTVNKNFSFQLSKCHEVIRTRKFLNANWGRFYFIPIAYTGMSLLNRGIHDDKPLLDNSVPLVAGSSIIVGTTALLLRNRHCKMKDNWQLKVLDFDIYKERKERRE